MIRNMGTADRYARALLALIVGLLWLTGIIGGGLAIGLGVLAGIFLLTSFVGFCPLYRFFDISTWRRPA